MNSHVLVTYATKYGATAEIAVKIGTVLREAGIETDVMPVENVDTLSAYDAIVLGSAVYMGQWRGAAAQFLKQRQTILSTKLLWIFSSGPTGSGDPIELMKGWNFPDGLQAIADAIQPQDITVFHGNVNPNRLNMLEKWILNRVKAPVGDFRDWDRITEWANQIAKQIQLPELA